LVFDNDTKNPPKPSCWEDSPNTTKGAFSRRPDNYWGLRIEKEQPLEEPIQIDFSQCVDPGQVNAIAVNVLVSRLELQRKSPNSPEVIEDGRQFGIFVEDTSGKRREYTIWVGADKSMYLRVRENGDIISNDVVVVINSNILKIDDFSSPYFHFAKFPIQFFLEINNQGFDILRLKEGSSKKAVTTLELDSNQMQLFNELPALGEVQQIGLIGYGGDTQTLIWPLAFFTMENK
jgi:hypothetical protein